ncbi:hypothetical protein KO525_01390 [Psychrosphaera sp. B3R10]|nr:MULTISPECIES: hypothetical protein [unclassified Psychrosphaera]MBU2882812.1 hypothetical protein [Psychrosphaera sp. I2R16]MBU2988038.1 hypothetical protein [Psychrosphaera sp. B3R10]MDO6721058.1 hypothetical protein [Psychrosphaera sp. 1_MG-2023]
MSEQNNNWKQQNINNTKRLAAWTFAWLITMAIASFGPVFIWDGNTTMSSISVAINLLVGIGMIWANKKHLAGLDEMQQKVQLNAMAIALGVGLVFGLAYSNLDIANVIESDAEISHLVMLIGITYLVSTIIGLRKYQ